MGMIEVEIWFDDLEPAAQVRLCEALGTTPDKENWETMPVCTFHREVSDRKGTTMKTTGKYNHKNYQCTKCFTMETHGTNHWGDIYPYCKQCREVTVWECLEKMPEGYEKPAPWKMVKLGDICEITKGGQSNE